MQDPHRKMASSAFVALIVSAAFVIASLGELRMRAYVKDNAPYVKDRDEILLLMRDMNERLERVEELLEE